MPLCVCVCQKRLAVGQLQVLTPFWVFILPTVLEENAIYSLSYSVYMFHPLLGLLAVIRNFCLEQKSQKKNKIIVVFQLPLETMALCFVRAGITLLS